MEKEGANFSLVNLNVLPEVYLPRRIRLSSILLPAGIIVFAGLLGWMGFLVSHRADDISLLRSQITSAESDITAEEQTIVTRTAEVKQVEDAIPPVQAITNALNTTLTSLEAGREQVDGDLTDIFTLLPDGINLTEVNHQGDPVTVTGIATDEGKIFAYATALSTPFPNVVISSIVAIEEAEVITGFNFVLLLK